MSKRHVSLHLCDIKLNRLVQLIIGEILEVTRLIFPLFYFSLISNVVIEIYHEYTNKIVFIFDNKMRELCLSITLIIGLVL